MRTVFHLTTGDPDEQARALSSVANLIADESADVDDVAVVANADAVRMFLSGATNADRVRALADGGVGFRACSNSLQRADVLPSRLLDPVEVVNSGVGELTRLQSAGYAYVRL